MFGHLHGRRLLKAWARRRVLPGRSEPHACARYLFLTRQDAKLQGLVDEEGGWHVRDEDHQNTASKETEDFSASTNSLASSHPVVEGKIIEKTSKRNHSLVVQPSTTPSDRASTDDADQGRMRELSELRVRVPWTFSKLCRRRKSWSLACAFSWRFFQIHELFASVQL